MRTSVLCIACVAAYACLVLAKPQLPLRSSVSAEDVMRSARTGDVLLYRSRTASRSFLVLNPYTHVSTIVRHKGRAFSVEIHAAGDGPTGLEGEGVYAYPLEQRLATNGQRTDLFLVRRQGPDIDASSLALPVVPYNTSYVRDEATCHFLGISPDISKKMHCANFASFVLRELGIARAAASCVRPIDVVSSLPLREGHAYVSVHAIS